MSKKIKLILEPIPDSSEIKVILLESGHEVTFKTFFDWLIKYPKFVLYVRDKILSSSFDCLRWEHPALNQNKLDESYESILIHAPELNKRARYHDFEEHFNDDLISVFDNLRGDARLIVPKPIDNLDYAHLTNFLREAPDDQIKSFFGKASQNCLELIQKRNVWFNTAGSGVPWLHLRLDSRPKYYHHIPYRSEP